MTVEQQPPQVKAPRTEAQRQQARINGSRSRGPKTAEGKAKSCRNSTRHGHRAEKLVDPVDVPRLEDLRGAILGDLPRPVREVDRLAAGDIAAAAIRVEKIGAFRASAVAQARREIRRQHDRELEQTTELALKLIAEGKPYEGYELRRQDPRGCEHIAEIWSEIRDELLMLPAGAPVPESTWRVILVSLPTLEPVFRSTVQPLYEEASRDGSIGARALIEHCEAYIRTALDRAARLHRDRRRSLRHRRIEAEADLGPAGQLRDRYLQMARSMIARTVREMDLETHRQWRRDKEGWPSPNEPDDSPPDGAGSSAEAIPARGRPEAPPASPGAEGRAHAHEDEGMPPTACRLTECHEAAAPNEPDTPPQVPGKSPGDGTPGGLPSSSWACERPEAPSVSPRPEVRAQPQEVEGMAPGAIPESPSPNEPEPAPSKPAPARRAPAPNEPGAAPGRPPSFFPPGFVESLRPPWLNDEDEVDEALIDEERDPLKSSAMGLWMAQKLRELSPHPQAPAPNEPDDPPRPRGGPARPPQDPAHWPDPGRR
ncbi:MAG: hypothetical protein U0800_27045 [Isosphaeraceae bacterium]